LRSFYVFFSFPDFCSFHVSLRLARVLLLARACTAAGGLYFAAIDVYGIVFRPLWYYRHFLGEQNRAGFGRSKAIPERPKVDTAGTRDGRIEVELPIEIHGSNWWLCQSLLRFPPV